MSLTADQRLAGPLLKLNRAKFHIENLRATLEQFIATNPYRTITKHDPETGYVTHYLERADPIPATCSVLVGDALNNLRSALDHLAQQFYLVGSGATTESFKISYPIFEDVTSYNEGAGGKVIGMRQEAIDFISATKPYHGGNDLLWQIHKLNIIDKHRTLLTVIGIHWAKQVDITSFIRAAQAAGGTLRTQFTLQFHNAIGPTKEGDVVLSFKGEANQHVRHTFGVALHEPPIVENRPVVSLLTEFADTVDGILNRARPLLG